MKIKLLPLDERPCNIDFPEKICKYNNKVEIISPTLDILGLKKKEANYEDIKNFIFKNNDDINYLVISIDMFLYGGLIPSRLHHLDFQEIISRLNTLRKLKKKNSNLKIYAFSTIMRTPRYNSADEEPDYYGDHGENIFYKKYLEDKRDISSLTKEEEKQLLEIKIPDEFEQDYKIRRNTNLKVNLKIIELLEDSTLDYLIFPQDDSAPYGYTRIDQEQVYKKLEKLDVDKYSVHPGADEVAMTLVARIYNLNKTKLPKLYIEYSNKDSIYLIPNYEDRSLKKTLDLHIKSSGFTLTRNVKEADYLLYYNTANENPMLESWEQEKCSEISYNFSNFEKPFFVLDKRFSNGGDLNLVNILMKEYKDKLLGYSAWNTNANSLGTILCIMALSKEINEESSRKFLYERIIEDCFFQAKVRQNINKNELKNLNLTYFDLKDRQEEVVKIEKKQLNNLINKKIGEKINYNLSHPWNRMFEIRIDITEIK